MAGMDVGVCLSEMVGGDGGQLKTGHEELGDGATSNAVANRRERNRATSFAIFISSSAGRPGSSNEVQDDGRLPPFGKTVIQDSMAWLEWRPVLRSFVSTARMSNSWLLTSLSLNLVVRPADHRTWCRWPTFSAARNMQL
jgi:hypothetical protein